MIPVLVHDGGQAADVFLLRADRPAVTLFVVTAVIAVHIHFEGFGRFLRNDVDNSSDCTRTVQGRGGAFHDLDPFDMVGVEAVVIHVVERFARHTFAIDQEKHIFATHPLHVDSDLSVHLAGELHTRQFRRQQILHGDGIEFLYVGSGDYTSDDGSVFQQLRRAGSRNGYFIQVESIFFQTEVNGRVATQEDTLLERSETGVFNEKAVFAGLRNHQTIVAVEIGGRTVGGAFHQDIGIRQCFPLFIGYTTGNLSGRFIRRQVSGY